MSDVIYMDQSLYLLLDTAVTMLGIQGGGWSSFYVYKWCWVQIEFD
jgi:hypothetical protein